MSQVKYLTGAALQKFMELLADKLVTDLAGKVDVVNGKGLSTEDFTSALKTKLEGIDTDNLLSAQDKAKIHDHSNKAVLDTLDASTVAALANVIESIKVNGTAQTITSKEVDIAVPTDLNQLTNTPGYQTAAQVTSAINTAIGQITQFDYSVVADLPASGEKGVIYLKAATGSSDPDVYDEYIWLAAEGNNAARFEKIGTSAIALSQYWSKSELTFATLSDSEVEDIFDEVFNPEEAGE